MAGCDSTFTSDWLRYEYSYCSKIYKTRELPVMWNVVGVVYILSVCGCRVQILWCTCEREIKFHYIWRFMLMHLMMHPIAYRIHRCCRLPKRVLCFHVFCLPFAECQSWPQMVQICSDEAQHSNGRLSIFNNNCSSSYNQLRSRLFEAKNLFWRGSMHRSTSQKLPTYQSEKETLMIDIVPCFWRHHVAIILTIGGTQHSNHIISLVSRVNSFKAQIQLKTILDSIKSFESVMSL